MLFNVIVLCFGLSVISAQSCIGHEEQVLLNGIKSALQTLETKLKAKSVRCFPGWKEFENHCYNFIPTKVTWSEAERSCRKIGGYLAKVNNESESTWLKQQASVIGSSLWIGATVFSERNWLWIVDFSNTTSTDWYPGQPSNSGGNQDCLEMRKSHNYQWNDIMCSTTNGYICESEKGGACIPYSKQLFRK
ncbi:perlucin-like protein [Mytilus galloprovincialis]|uniref:perlucin-like protein n=1 Tax=Mytilus galloprovincialis TaxID=29158 RepID=UPI003F7B3F1B